LIARGGASTKFFNTINLVNHLKARHGKEFQRIRRHNEKLQREVFAILHYRQLDETIYLWI